MGSAEQQQHGKLLPSLPAIRPVRLHPAEALQCHESSANSCLDVLSKARCLHGKADSKASQRLWHVRTAAAVAPCAHALARRDMGRLWTKILE